MSVLAQRALGVGLGLVLDRALGEPPDAWHPVAWFGTAMTRVEDRLYRDTRSAGLLHAAAGAGLGAAGGALLTAMADLSRGARHVRLGDAPDSHVPTVTGRLVLRGAVPVAVPLALALAVGVAAAGRMLRETSRTIEEHLLRGDVETARTVLPSLVGRDPSGLDGSGVAAAVVESLAENTVDAVVAPVFWGLVAGAPGVLAHRAVNTMDAMVGHRNTRYARYGWAAARLDDAMAWLPARLFAAVVAALQPRRARDVVRLVRRDAPAHPSPNSGVAETAVAAALGVELGGPLRYGDRVEDRPRLGDGPRPQAGTITRARRLVDRVELTVVALCLATWWLGRPPPATARVRSDKGTMMRRRAA